MTSITYPTPTDCNNTRQGYDSSATSAARSSAPSSLPPVNLSSSMAITMQRNALPLAAFNSSSPRQKLDTSSLLRAAIGIARGDHDDIILSGARNDPNLRHVVRQ